MWTVKFSQGEFLVSDFALFFCLVWFGLVYFAAVCFNYTFTVWLWKLILNFFAATLLPWEVF